MGSIHNTLLFIVTKAILSNGLNVGGQDPQPSVNYLQSANKTLLTTALVYGDYRRPLSGPGPPLPILPYTAFVPPFFLFFPFL